MLMEYMCEWNVMSSNEPGLNEQFLCDKIMYLSLMPKRILVKEFKVSVHVFSNDFS